jgi:uncharacterized protein (TIGR03545 family)
VEILFPRPKQPDFLIRSLALDGEGEFAGQRIEFVATAADLTTQPELYGRPAVLKADLKVPLAMHVEVVVDRSGPQPYDRITVDCPRIPQAERVLGRPDQLAVTVSPGSTHLVATIELKGEQLSGCITVRQEPVQLVPQFAATHGGSVLGSTLQTAMSQIHEVDATVNLSGTLQKPIWKFRCNLGQQLAAAINTALQHELETRRNQLAAAARQQIDAQFTNFDHLIVDKQQTILSKLQLGSDELKQLTQSVAQRMPLPNQMRLPAQLPLPGQPPAAGQSLGRELAPTMPRRF